VSVVKRSGSDNRVDRWHLVKDISEKRGLSIKHFLHVPKTGGTTFAESLLSDGKALIVSVDAEREVFERHLSLLRSAKPGDRIITRSHHPYSVLEVAGMINHVDLMFSAYRDPVDLHISNVNMIMRRVSWYLSGAENIPSSIRRFCIEWLERFEVDYSDTKEFARQLIFSKAYLDYMGSIYSKYYNTDEAIAALRGGGIKVIYFTDFDDMFTFVMGYDCPPKRKNITKISYLDRKEFSDEEVGLLIGKDRGLLSDICSAMVKPEELVGLF